MIRELALENFKAFGSLELPLAPLTLLTGVNAAGKSTTMQALALLRQSWDAKLLDRQGGLLLNGDLVELGVGQDILYEDFATDKRKTPHIGITLGTDLGNFGWRVEYDLARDREADMLPLATVPSSEVPDNLFGAGFQYLKADRIVPAVYYPKSYDAAVRRRFLGTRGEHSVNFLRVQRDDAVIPLLRHRGALSTSLLDNAEAWLQELCPGVNIEAEDLRGTDLVRLSYGFFGRSGVASSNIRYRPTNVGFGLTYALPIVVACLSAAPDSLIMLENPEAHLHPRGQSAMAHLACLAAASGAQVIMETHSDHVLNGIRLAVKDQILTDSAVSLHYFHRSARGTAASPVPPIEVSSPQLGPDGMLSNWPSGFFDEWDTALDRLLD
ncbi:MAG: AAA family ATPase [Pseudonocardiaceae bacterium]